MKGDFDFYGGDSRNQAWSTGSDEKSQDLSLVLRISPRKCKVAGTRYSAFFFFFLIDTRSFDHRILHLQF